MTYYNEHDKYAAAWLRELIKEGHIAPGEVDERSICDVRATDLVGFRQCHFFAGIGGWSVALRLAGVPDDLPVWTGSCPCQPFSAAGAGKGTADERHLWPEFYRLIRECRPAIVFGEQVASAAVVGGAAKPSRRKPVAPAECVWLDGVFADLEAAYYACGASDLPAAGVGEKGFENEAEFLRWCVASRDPRTIGREAEILAYADHLGGIILSAPHIRQRLYWTANARRGVRRWWITDESGSSTTETQEWALKSGRRCLSRGLADVQQPGLEGHARDGDDRHEPGRLGADAAGSVAASGSTGGMVFSNGAGSLSRKQSAAAVGHGSSAVSTGSWSAFDILPCRDGKARRVESGTFPLVESRRPQSGAQQMADGLSGNLVPSGPVSVSEAQATGEARVARLRGYGNAIVPQLAAEFIQAALESII